MIRRVRHLCSSPIAWRGSERPGAGPGGALELGSLQVEEDHLTTKTDRVYQKRRKRTRRGRRRWHPGKEAAKCCSEGPVRLGNIPQT